MSITLMVSRSPSSWTKVTSLSTMELLADCCRRSRWVLGSRIFWRETKRCKANTHKELIWKVILRRGPVHTWISIGWTIQSWECKQIKAVYLVSVIPQVAFQNLSSRLIKLRKTIIKIGERPTSPICLRSSMMIRRPWGRAPDPFRIMSQRHWILSEAWKQMTIGLSEQLK